MLVSLIFKKNILFDDFWKWHASWIGCWKNTWSKVLLTLKIAEVVWKYLFFVSEEELIKLGITILKSFKFYFQIWDLQFELLEKLQISTALSLELVDFCV